MSESGNDYSNEPELPPLVRAAADLAERTGFRNSCAIVYGRLLHALAGQCVGGTIGEMGTGCGVGTAWMASAVPAETRIITIEVDAERAAAARELFAASRNITVLQGDSLGLGDHGPFDLLFCDGGGKSEDQEVTVSMVRRKGLIVLDDLTPGRSNGPRAWWLNNPDLHAIEISVGPDNAAILAMRR